MIENYRIKQIGTLFSEEIEDQPAPPRWRRRTSTALPIRVLGLLRDAMTQLDGAPRPRRARVWRKEDGLTSRSGKPFKFNAN
ncbi:MAG: hypothetical protein K2X62_17140 [Beijerinckiaceae bacterium]|jgi:hypothetical protein|nr:hypothetical protein [Beijerinckiaceae bacterium]MDO9441712.1 hypothetical protein [Beijerinckiaceae bacterium]